MKSKKKFLLLGVGAMGVVALGVGATSTMAWFQATQTFTAATKTSSEAIEVGTNSYSLGGYSVQMKITAQASVTGLGLAHYNNAGENKGAPFLTTGYINGVGTFVDLGYAEAPAPAGTPNYGSWTTEVTKLTTTITFKIDVDWEATWSNGVRGGWFSDASCTSPTTTRGAAAYFKDASGNINPKATVLESLATDTVIVGVKPSAADANTKGARIIQAGGLPSTAVAENNDPLLASGLTPVVYDNGTANDNSDDVTYAQVAASQALTGIDSSEVNVANNALMYVWGGLGGNSLSADEVAVDGSIDLYLA